MQYNSVVSDMDKIYTHQLNGFVNKALFQNIEQATLTASYGNLVKTLHTMQ